MDIAKMLNVTILACLLILTGCFGLGATDDDVIDDADAEDSGSGSTTVVNTYPPVQHYNAVGNATLTVPAGSSIEVLEIWGATSGQSVGPAHLGLNSGKTHIANVSCSTMQHNATLGNGWWPSDGGSCTYTFWSYTSIEYERNGTSTVDVEQYFVDLPISIVYRVWS